MSKVFIEEDSLTAIGNAIREKTGGTDTLSVPSGMVDAIASISGGGSSSIDWDSLQSHTITKKIGSSSSVKDNNVTIKIPGNTVCGIMQFSGILDSSPASLTYGKLYQGSALFLKNDNGKITLVNQLINNNNVPDYTPTYFGFGTAPDTIISYTTSYTTDSNGNITFKVYICGKGGSQYKYVSKSSGSQDDFIFTYYTKTS